MPQRKASLPTWARVLSSGKIIIDANLFYPEIIKELWEDKNWNDEPLLEGLQRGQIDSYWLEVAYQVAKMDIQNAVSGTELTPDKGGALVIIVEDVSKSDNGVSKWAQKSAPTGRNTEAATKGREAREHYNRIRTVLN